MSNNMHPAEALGWLTQAINDYIRTLPPSASAPTGALAQQAIDALKPLVIGAVPDAGLAPNEGEQRA